MAELRHHQRPIVLLPLVDKHQRRERYEWEAARTAWKLSSQRLRLHFDSRRAPDNVDRDSERAQHHQAIVARCIAVHVCANRPNSSSNEVPLHL
jgi:hypothetical protein